MNSDDADGGTVLAGQLVSPPPRNLSSLIGLGQSRIEALIF